MPAYPLGDRRMSRGRIERGRRCSHAKLGPSCCVGWKREIAVALEDSLLSMKTTMQNSEMMEYRESMI